MKSLEKLIVMGLEARTAGLTTATCNRLAVLHSWPGLQDLPDSEELSMSWQQSGSIASIIAVPGACIGQGSAGISTAAIPLRGSAKLSRQTKQSRR